MSTIVTFYSYKGGVGRTMAMANVAVLLASRGMRVLAVDWDLEAPGLERYFGYFTIKPSPGGLLRLLRDHRGGSPGHYRPHLAHVSGTLGERPFELDVLPSGREADPSYSAALERFDWDAYFRKGGGDFIEGLRSRWRTDYDATLIDSRTGLSDTGGICTIQLPDVVVAMFTANYQSLYGVLDTMRLAQAARDRLAYDRMHLRVLPLPARFSQHSDSVEAQEWMGRIADVLGEFYQDWLPSWASPRQLTENLRIPQVDAFGFGEKLAVMETGAAPDDEMLRVYRHLAAVLVDEGANAATVLGLHKPDPTTAQPPPAPRTDDYEYDIFVAHATGSVLDEWLGGFVNRLRTFLSAELGREPRVFLDLTQVRSGDTWNERVEESLRRSRILLAIVTPEFLASSWCRLEWAAFERREMTHPQARPLIFPVILRRPEAIPEWMLGRQEFDLTHLPRQVWAVNSPDTKTDEHLRVLATFIHARLRAAPPFDPNWTVSETGTAIEPVRPPAPPPAGPSDFQLDAEAIAALLAKEGRPEVVEAGQRLVKTLLREQDYASLVKVAAAVHRWAPDDVETTLSYARALLETAAAAEAAAVLSPVVKALGRSHHRFAEATALQGDAYKQLFAGMSSKRSREARSALSSAIAAYRASYSDTAHLAVDGVNLVALLAAARRLGIAAPKALNHRTLARTILKRMAHIPESLRGPEYHAALAQLRIALDDWDSAEAHIRAFVGAAQGRSHELTRLLRQLTDIWELPSDRVHGAPLIAALQAIVLSAPGGSVNVTIPAAAAGTRSEPALDMVLGESEGRTLRWMQTGLERARAVGVVVGPGGQRYGTCFLVEARAVDVELDELVVVTASHIVGGEGAHTVSPRNVSVMFEAATPPLQLEVVSKAVWSSPADRLDTTILKLRHRLSGVEPLPLAGALPSVDLPQRVYVVGHPGGRGLTISLQDNELLDHEGPPAGTPAQPGVVRLHYRAATEAGSSGSPVFNNNWEVIALHHRGGDDIPRLNGKAGTYAANEGIWIQSIARARKSR